MLRGGAVAEGLTSVTGDEDTGSRAVFTTIGCGERHASGHPFHSPVDDYRRQGPASSRKVAAADSLLGDLNILIEGVEGLAAVFSGDNSPLSGDLLAAISSGELALLRRKGGSVEGFAAISPGDLALLRRNGGSMEGVATIIGDQSPLSGDLAVLRLSAIFPDGDGRSLLSGDLASMLRRKGASIEELAAIFSDDLLARKGVGVDVDVDGIASLLSGDDAHYDSLLGRLEIHLRSEPNAALALISSLKDESGGRTGAAVTSKRGTSGISAGDPEDGDPEDDDSIINLIKKLISSSLSMLVQVPGLIKTAALSVPTTVRVIVSVALMKMMWRAVIKIVELLLQAAKTGAKSAWSGLFRLWNGLRRLWDGLGRLWAGLVLVLVGLRVASAMASQELLHKVKEVFRRTGPKPNPPRPRPKENASTKGGQEEKKKPEGKVAGEDTERMEKIIRDSVDKWGKFKKNLEQLEMNVSFTPEPYEGFTGCLTVTGYYAA